MSTDTALTTPNRSVEAGGRRLAYRRFGRGPDLVLCVRLRGTMDSWDPLFLDELARHFTVTTFDYSGLGLSTGTPSYGKAEMARDVDDLVSALGLGRVAVAGWSLGGFAAMAFAALHPGKVSHVLAIGSGPPGLQRVAPEPIFLETALKPAYSVEDEYLLFFEPDSAASRRLGDASMARIASRSVVVDAVTPVDVFHASLAAATEPSSPFPDPDGRYTKLFTEHRIPVLALCGDHDPMFPVENWYAYNDQWPSLFIATYPECGHAPQHQYPVLSADLIASFVRNTPAG